MDIHFLEESSTDEFLDDFHNFQRNWCLTKISRSKLINQIPTITLLIKESLNFSKKSELLEMIQRVNQEDPHIQVVLFTSSVETKHTIKQWIDTWLQESIKRCLQRYA
jgi:hypothetical protein